MSSPATSYAICCPGCGANTNENDDACEVDIVEHDDGTAWCIACHYQSEDDNELRRSLRSIADMISASITTYCAKHAPSNYTSAGERLLERLERMRIAARPVAGLDQCDRHPEIFPLNMRGGGPTPWCSSEGRQCQKAEWMMDPNVHVGARSRCALERKP